MEQEKRSLRIGGYLVVFALLLRLFGGSIWDSTVRFFTRADVASAILFLETGRLSRPSADLQATTPAPAPTEAAQTTAPLLFSAEDEALEKEFAVAAPLEESAPSAPTSKRRNASRWKMLLQGSGEYEVLDADQKEDMH